MSKSKTALPEPGTIWLARDGRRMSLLHWMSDRSSPTALMAVLNPGRRMRRYSEQNISSFGSFLTKVVDQPHAE